jgi:prolipoprotein diacylglyceryltransferase
VSITDGVITLDFDPWLRLGTFLVRWEAIGLALAILIALLVFRWSVSRTVGHPHTDDVVFVVLAALPGAVVGGRLVHGLDFLAAYSADPAALLDLGRGSLSLVGAVAGGVLSAAYVCRLLGFGPGRWLDAAAVPLLLAIGLGKLAMTLGGAGQGAAYDGPLATAYLGSGWVSAAAATPSYPAQVYEGLWVLLGGLLLLLLTRRAAEQWPGSGRRFLAAICWWLTGRLAIGFAWRDDRVLGPFNAEQLATAAVLLLAVATLPVVSVLRSRRRGPTPSAPAASTVVGR